MEKNTTIFSCEMCHKIFLRKSSRNRHVREQHLQPNKYHCKQCGLRFSKKYNLKVHTEYVHSKNLKKIKCSDCTAVFTKYVTLKKHVNVNHKRYASTVSANNSLEHEKDGDVRSLAESVLKELKQLQRDIQTSEELSPNHTERQEELIESEGSTMNVISIKDNLYPLGHFTLLKVQTIKHMDGTVYMKCEFCTREFKKTYNYLRHRRIHTKVRPFVCVLCKKSFPTTAELRTHCSIHKLDDKFGLFHKLYKCPQCNEGFSAIQQLDKHLSPMASGCDVSFQCPRCLKSYKTLKTLLRHKHSEKDNELEILKAILPTPVPLNVDNDGFFECNFCGIQINEKTLLKQHEKRHENLFKNQCSKCRCSFVTQSALKIHTKIHINSRRFRCNYCTKCFNTIQNCRRHVLTHLKQLLKTYDGIQDQDNTLLLYPTFIKNGEVETTTSIIKSSRKCKIKRNETNSTHKEFKYKCSKCEKSFRYNAWLRKHFTYKHSEESPHECSRCFRKFRTKQSLENHLVVHSTERAKITCQVCGRLYASSKSLKLHIRIHTQEKPFSCNKCVKVFRTSGHLIQHRKANHKE